MTGPEALARLRANITETAAKPEVAAEKIRVAHILVSFKGAMRATVDRARDEAELRAAELLARVEAGEDFLALMRATSDDPGEGVYGMTMAAPGPDYFPRTAMAPAFGDVGWRLNVGQVGVAAFDAAKSPFGWHIIKRVE